MPDIRIMGVDPSKKKVEAHLTKEEYAAFKKVANERQWSDKKLNENIIRWYLEGVKTKPKK
jgi:hypothetical protein